MPLPRPMFRSRRGCGRPTRRPTPYMPPAPLSLADAASQLGIRPVHLAEAIREGKWRRFVGGAASC